MRLGTYREGTSGKVSFPEANLMLSSQALAAEKKTRCPASSMISRALRFSRSAGPRLHKKAEVSSR